MAVSHDVPPATLTVAEAKRVANRSIRRSLFAADAEPLAFFCECDDPHCYRPVWLTPAEYDEASSASDGGAQVQAHDEPEERSAP